MSSYEDWPFLGLLVLAAQRERERLLEDLSAKGFEDISYPGLRIVGTVLHAPGSIQSIAQATATTKQFTAREVQKLREARYVTVSPSPEDGRATLVRIAERGRKLTGFARAGKMALDAQIRKKLGDGDARELKRLLARLVED